MILSSSNWFELSQAIRRWRPPKGVKAVFVPDDVSGQIDIVVSTPIAAQQVFMTRWVDPACALGMLTSVSLDLMNGIKPRNPCASALEHRLTEARACFESALAGLPRLARKEDGCETPI